MLGMDDLLIAGKNGWDVANVKASFAEDFEMKDLDQLEDILGMRITRSPNGEISIDQSGYISFEDLNDTECRIQGRCRRR